MVDASTQLLAINSDMWRRALAVWQQCGVSDPRGIGTQQPHPAWL
jgi:hypothetical protein